MNKEFIIFNLTEAKDALDQIIHDFHKDPEYEKADLWVDITHVYHHVNTAWNAQDISEQQVASQTDKEFYEWRQFPKDINLS
ncbi:MAG: hypothetical protein ACYC6Z_06080 [Thermoleophilia bacterium]